MIRMITVFLLVFVPSAFAEKLDQVVAVVNDGVVTESELTKQMQHVKQQLNKNQIKQPDQKAFKRQVLDHMIARNLQLQMAKKAGLEIDDHELNQTVSELAAQNKMTVNEFKKDIAASGMGYAKFRTELKNDMMINEVQKAEVGKNVVVSDEEIADFIRSHPEQETTLAEYNLRTILIPLPETPSSMQVQQASAQAQQVMAYLNSGKDFSEVAAENSAGEHAFEGGDLGWRKQVELPSIFASKVTIMKKGEVADPIRAGNGFHIIKLQDKREQQLQHYVDQTKVRHILIKTDEVSDDEEIKIKLQLIRDRIINGENFAKLAENYSHDVKSASQGGDLGWVSPGVLVAEFESTINMLEKNQISQPIQTQFGWHIIQVLGRKHVDDSKLLRKNQVRQFIYKRKYEEHLQNWLQQTRNESYVKVML